MKLIVGLGNPGKDYNNTRHNIGFDAIDILAKAWMDYEGPDKSEKTYSAKEYALGEGEKVLLVKPLTFMNRSGEVVKALVKKYENKLDIASDLIVIHDELDLMVGDLKVSFDASSAGHNGVQNIIDQLGTKAFARVRIGIMDPEGMGNIPVEDYVLKRFTVPQQEAINEVIEQIPTLMTCFIKKGLEEARNQYNKKKST